MSSIKHRIEQLLREASQFNSNDVLVGIDSGNVLPIETQNISNQDFFELQLDVSIRSIVDSAKRVEREQGIFPLCIAKHYLEWEFKQGVVRTPLLLTPCTAEINKITKTVRILLDDEGTFVNPFLLNRLSDEFDLKTVQDIPVDQLAEFIRSKGFKGVHEGPVFLGNFHHHRFEIIKELDELLGLEPSQALEQLLGNEAKGERSDFHLGSALLFPADVDQLAVFDALSTSHTVVQGPPGTGKSQVLSNVLGKTLLNGNSAIVVSEKRVALEVLQKKLNQFGLGHLCFIASSETIARDVLKELKDSWVLLENYESFHRVNLRLSEQYLDQLQLQLDLLNRESLIGGISYTEFVIESGIYDLEKAVFNSDLPDMKEWISARDTVKDLFDKGLPFYVSGIAPGIIQHDSFKQLDRSMRNWLNELSKLKQIFVLDTYADLHQAMKRAALCQHYTTETFRKYEKILTPGTKDQERFLKLRKKYMQLQLVHGTLENEKNNWKIEPSQTETEALLSLLQNTSLRGKWKFRKQWSRVAAIPDTVASDALHKWKQYLSNANSISQLKVDFCEIGISDVASELEFVHQQIHHFSPESKTVYSEIPQSDRQLYANENQALHQLYTQLKTHFRWEDHIQPELFLSELLEAFSTLLSLHSKLKELSEPVIRNLKLFLEFGEMEAAVCKSNFTRFTAQFPQFSKFAVAQLLDKCHTVIEEQDTEARSVAQEIMEKQHDRFRYYHQILQTPAAKLTSAEKELKATLKKGKSILVKEFGKTRNFPSLRELFASEARLWIQLFKPVWLSNPSQIAKCFPMQQGLFDLAIFDEASQIPLQNGLGTIQRSERILVAGDHQQMGPSSYFKAQSEEVIDLLHQSAFYWKNVSLKHHYRSEHPELIRFSNKHFYNNELIAFPSYKREKEPTTFHFVANAIYDDRVNEKEAETIAAFIEKNIHSEEHLGIVAFSETQLKAIHSKLSPSCQEILENRVETDSAFFKALENVQGEECDHLIISLGYGKDPEGNFHMRFGPLNTRNGSKRLNVLLTRARKKIDFFASIKGGDFKISSNEAVDLLRLYLLQIENASERFNELELPSGLQPSVKDNTLEIREIYSTIRSAQELVTFVRVLEGRGWKVKVH